MAERETQTVEVIESSWTSPRGLKHRVLSWVPKGTPRAAIGINHGLGEHIGRYDALANFFASNGFVVRGLDHEGHGRSEGRPNMLLSNIIKDCVEFHQQFFSEYPDIPKFLYGHSMGALITLHCALLKPELYKNGVIMSAPALSVPVPKPVYWIGKAIAAIAPNAKLISVDFSTLCRDPQVVKEYNEDPCVWHDNPPLGFASDLLAHALDAFEGAKNFSVPYLIMAGSNDKIVEAAKIPEFFHATTGVKDKTCIWWEGMFHELHNEPEKRHVWAQALKWFEERLNKTVETNTFLVATVQNDTLNLQAKL